MSRKGPGSEGTLSPWEQTQAIEESIEIVRQAMRDILSVPKAQRAKHLHGLLKRIEEMTGKLDHTSETKGGSDRLKAAHEVIEILERMASDL